MKHARQDYAHIQDPTGKIPAGEPVFLLRGQDVCAPAAIEAWAEEADMHGVSQEMTDKALEHAKEMRLWQRMNGSKTPDMPVQGQAAASGGIHDLNGINTSTPEGQLLMAAIAKITTESQRDKTPQEVIGQLNELKAKMYDESGTAQQAWDSLVAECDEKQKAIELDAKAEAEDREKDL